MKFLKSPWVMTLIVVIASVFFSKEIIDGVEKVSPDMANKLRRTPQN